MAPSHLDGLVPFGTANSAFPGRQPFALGTGDGLPTGTWRGFGTSQINIQSNIGSGPSSKAQYVRRAVKFPIPFRRIKVVVPTFTAGTGSPGDVDIPAPVSVAVSAEYPFEKKASGLNLANRKRLLWGGAPSGAYSNSTGPFPAIVSDELDIGTVVPAYTTVGFHSVMEFAGSAQQGIPGGPGVRSFLFPASDAYWERSGNFNTSLLSTDAVMTLADLTTVEFTASAPINRYSVLFLLDCGPGTPSVLMVGDSILQYVNEGAGGADTSGAHGENVRGQADGYNSWAARWIGQYCPGVGYQNLAKASDRLAFQAAGYNTRRRALAAILSPTHMLIAMGTNDIGGSIAHATTVANFNTVRGQYLTSLGKTIPVSAVTLPPSSSSSDNWLTEAAQNPATNYGSGSTLYAQFNDAMRSGTGFVRDTVFDLSAALEDRSVRGANSAIWKTDPAGTQVKLYNGDGGHPSSFGHQKAAEFMRDTYGSPFA